VRRINVHFSAVFPPPRSKSSAQGPNPQIVDSQNHVQLGVPKDFPGGGSQQQLVPCCAAFEKLQSAGWLPGG